MASGEATAAPADVDRDQGGEPMSVRIERDGAVVTVTMSRPESRNAMDPETAEALVQAFEEFEEDPAAHVAVFWGEGGAFCSGWDLKHAARLAGHRDPLAHLNFPHDDSEPPPSPMGPCRLLLDKPVIAAIAGPAVAGGMELALWCDLRVMEEDAYLGVYNRRWGIPLIDGGTVRLPRLVGQGRALDIVLTGRKVPAEECLRIGLCERVVAHGRARPAAEALAQEIARFPQECVRADRRSVYGQRGLPLREALEQEWWGAMAAFEREGISGAARFSRGRGRHGDFENL
jgi:enoyl-CoA hydratase